MPDPFLLRVTLAGLGVALAAGPLGALILWRRMVYFGDTLSHGALLGVALALAAELPVVWGVLATGIAVALLVALPGLRGADERRLHRDARLGVAAHGALATGLVAVAVLPGAPPDPMRWLTGDILAVGAGDLAAIWAGGLAVTGLLAWRWRGLVLAALDPDLARARGIDPGREGLIFALAVAVMVAVAIKVVGALLITALLIIPAAAARPAAATPERMAVLAALLGALAAVLGIAASLAWDTPTGPSIVVAALAVLALMTGGRGLRDRLR